MASINYSKIARDFKKQADGFVELETQLRRPPKSDEAASLSMAYLNINNDNKSKASGNERKESSISNLYDALKSESKITEIPKSEISNEKEYINALKKVDTEKIRKMVLDEIVNQTAMESQLRTDINEKLGLTGELSEDLRTSIMDSYPEATKFGYGIEQVTKFMTTMMETSGRFNLVSRETLDRSYATARAFVGDLGDLADTIVQFEKVGVGARSAMDAIDKAGKGSLELGLRSKTTVTDIRNNIERLNSYGFQNGIQGLAEMSRRATEFRMKMDEVFTIADNVLDPEKALSLTANLQVLGGAIGDFNDPLKLMYMATNNVEGLQDALIGAAGSLATYNSEQGRFEITGVNLRRAKEMAKELGINYNELAKGAIAAQERQAASMELMGKGFNIDPEDKRFITNLSRMEGGKMIIDVPESLMKKLGITETQVELGKLTEQQIETLKENKKAFEDIKVENIAKEQFTSIKNIERMVNSLIKQQARGAMVETVGKEGLEVDRRAKDLYNIIEKFGNENKGFSREALGSVKEGYRDMLKNAMLEGGLDQFNEVLGEQLKTVREKLKLEYENKKETITPKETTDTRTSQNFNLKSKIDVTFPFGFGLPKAEQQGSYLIPS
jgi:hypothetical protein